jgi:DegV family protein with EDD domain
MAEIAIVTDTSVDLPPDLAEERGIFLAQNSVSFVDRTFRDGDLAPEEFYERLDREERPPRVSAPTPDEFAQAMERALKTAPAVLCLLNSFESSFTYAAALVAARGVGTSKVHIVNTGRTMCGQGALALVAAEAARNGLAWREAVALVEAQAAGTDTLASPASLTYLQKTGKLQAIEQAAGRGRLQGSAPVLRVRGRLTLAAREATREAAAATMAALMKDCLDGRAARVVVSHALAPVEAEGMAAAARAAIDCRELLVTTLGPMTGTSLGRGAVALGWCPLPG